MALHRHTELMWSTVVLTAPDAQVPPLLALAVLCRVADMNERASPPETLHGSKICITVFP